MARIVQINLISKLSFGDYELCCVMFRYFHQDTFDIPLHFEFNSMFYFYFFSSVSIFHSIHLFIFNLNRFLFAIVNFILQTNERLGQKRNNEKINVLIANQDHFILNVRIKI